MEQKVDEQLTIALTEQIEQAVPDSADIWPQVAQKLASRQAGQAAPRSRRRFAWTAIAAAAAAVAALAIRAAWPAPVSAQTVLTRAQAAYASPVHNFAIKERTVWHLGDRDEVIDLERWYQKPDKWRMEIPGKTVVVNDGAALWRYDPVQKMATVGLAGTGSEGLNAVSPFGAGSNGLPDLLARAAICHTPQLVQPQEVAGRKAYVLDLKPAPCAQNPTGADAGREMLWIDQETFFLLKAEYYRPDGSLVGRQEVTSVRYDQPIEPSLFNFSPGPDMTVYDSRPQPAPAPGREAEALTKLAGTVGYPLFVPRQVPSGWVPAAPVITPAGVELAYGPTAPSAPDAGSVLVVQRKASPSDSPFPGAEPIRIGNWDATFVAGTHLTNGARTSSTLTLIREGTRVSISSMELSRDELVKMAQSLVPTQVKAEPAP